MSTEWDPKALRAMLDQTESMWRDTLMDSAIAMEKAALERGASPDMAIEVGSRYLEVLVRSAYTSLYK